MKSLQLIDVRVDDIQPHPDHPDCWAVRFEVTYAGTVRTFWRWHTVRELEDGRYITPSSKKKPTPAEIITRFWDDTFAELHGFSFDKESP